MTINLTDKEYRLLLDVVFVADWVFRAHEADPTPEDDTYQMLFQKLYSYAGDMGCSDLVESVAESNSYAPTRKFEEETEAIDRIEEYDAMSFWEELIARLAERDAYAELPEEHRDRLSAKEYWKRVGPHEERYAQEFEAHGIDRLVIDKT